MNNLENNNHQKPEETSGSLRQEASQEGSSLLDQILAQPAQELSLEEKAILEEREKAEAAALQNKKKLTLKEVGMRVIAGSFGVATILAVLAGYVIFNPGQAIFLNQIFGIAIGDVAHILGLILNTAFALILGLVVVFWLYYLYRSFLKSVTGSKKAIAVLFAIFGFFFFIGVITAWARVYRELGSLEYTNAQVLLYDNDIYLQLDPKHKNESELTDTSRLIGPVSIRFDFSGFVRRKMKEYGLRSVDRYEIDFDGDSQIDRDGRDILGTPFIWLYNKNDGKSYQPKGRILGTDVTKKEVEIALDFPVITVTNEVHVVETRESAGGVRVAFDAQDLKTRGNVEWFTESKPNTPISTSLQFTPADVFTKTQWVCLSLYEGEAPSGKCDKYFIIRAEGDDLIRGTLEVLKDPTNYLQYKFAVKDLSFKQGSLQKVLWYVDNFQAGDGEQFENIFKIAGQHDVQAVVADTSGNKKSFSQRIIIDAPIVLKKGYTLTAKDEQGNSLLDDAFDASTNSYILNNVSFPQAITFDAVNIKAESSRLSLDSVDWDMNNDGEYETIGTYSHKILLTEEKVYIVRVRYNFKFLTADGSRPMSTTETVTLSTKKSPFDVRLKIIPNQEFAPAEVLLDASASQVSQGEIVRFQFDFGDGSPAADGSRAQASHIYSNPGVYTAKVVVFKGDGTSMSVARTFTIRQPQNVASIISSISRGRVALPVTFDASESRGNLSQVFWDFGDNSTGIGKTVDHAFEKAGTYEITLKIQYADGTVETSKKEFIVVAPE